MARIYLSSTSDDLAEQREAVSSALRRLGHEDVAMEYYVAEDRPPLDRCLDDVESCDLYVGVFAWRYGHVPETRNPDGLSFTELEYARAVQSGKTCLIFLLSEDAPWPRSKMDKDSGRIEAFREKLVNSGRIVDFFETADELARKVCEAVALWARENGQADERGPADWYEYREAVLERHQWVRLQVIAGASRERDPIRIPLTEVFEPQFVIAGVSAADVPDEVLQYREKIYGPRETALTEEFADGGDGELLAGSPEPVLDVLGRERSQVFLGGPGAGKSTLLQYAMLKTCEPAGSVGAVPPHLSGEPVPFVVELRGYVLEKDPDFVSYLVRRSGTFYGSVLDAGSITRALEAADKAVVFFDGLDEVFDPGDRKRVIEQFQAFAKQYSGCRIVVTSRIAGYDSTSLGTAGFQHYTLMPLTIAHIRAFAGHWYQHYTLEGTGRTAAGLVQRVIESPRLLDLAGNPMLLTMMAVIYKDRDLPNERWRLYQRCAETLLEDWDLGKGIKSDDFDLAVTIRTNQKSEMLQRVAMYMVGHAASGSELNAIAYGPLQGILAGYLTDKYQRAEGEAEAISVDILQHLMERTYVLAGIGERIFGFVHRTFMEYFAACRCLAEFNARAADFDWLKDDIYGAHWQDPAWQEILLLLIAMLHDQGTPIAGVIEHLRQAEDGRYPYHLAFAARCLGEITDAQEQPTGQQILTNLAEAIADAGTGSYGKHARNFVETALGAFTALAAVVNPPDELQALVARLQRQGNTAGIRIIGWQMGFALRSHEERLGYARLALADPEEVIRRGAIAALEREWPGRADLAPVLAGVVSDDRRGNVRLAALAALERSWPHEPVVLDAIEKRAGMESSHEAIRGFVEYLGANWPGNARALRLAINLAERVSEWHVRQLYPDIAAGLARGWPYDPEAVHQVLGMAVAYPNAPRSILGRWAMQRLGDPRALSFIETIAADSDHEGLRQAALSVIMDIWPWRESPQLSDFVRARAVHDPEARVRLSVLRHIALSWEWINDITRSFVRDRAIADPDQSVREEVFAALLRHRSNDQFVRAQATDNPEGAVRGAALAALIGSGERDAGIPAFIRGEIAGDADPAAPGAGLRALARSRYLGASEAAIFIELQIADDPDASVRAHGLAALVRKWAWHDSAAVSFVRYRLAREPAPSVRLAGIAAFSDFPGEIMVSAENSAAVLALLQDRAIDDPAASVRAAVLRVIAEIGFLYRQSDIREWLELRAVRDPDAEVRAAARRQLGQAEAEQL